MFGRLSCAIRLGHLYRKFERDIPVLDDSMLGLASGLHTIRARQVERGRQRIRLTRGTVTRATLLTVDIDTVSTRVCGCSFTWIDTQSFLARRCFHV